MDNIIFLLNNDYKKLLNIKYINKKYFDDNHLIHLSIIYNNESLFDEIVKKYNKKIIYEKNNKKENIFHFACKYKFIKFINKILKIDITFINQQDFNGNIGLHYLLNDKVQVLKLLNNFNNNIIKKKIDLNKISNVYG